MCYLPLGVHIIPKIANFLDPKIIIFAPIFKKNAPNLKNIFKFHLPICPHLPPIIKNAPNYKKCPQLKNIFQITLTHLPPIKKKCP